MGRPAATTRRPPGTRERYGRGVFAAAVVLAAGSGTRVGAAGNKVYLPVAGRRLISWSLRAFAAVPEVGRLVLVIRPDDRAVAERTVEAEVGAPVELVIGGVARHDSEHRALAQLAPAIRAGEIDVVAIHDGARPVVDPRLVAEIIAAAARHGGAIPGLPLADLAMPHPEHGPEPVPSNRRLVRVQTPQAFRAGPLLAAYECAARDGFSGTDTAACFEAYAGAPVRCLPGDPRNIKVTYPADLLVAAHLLG
jgi:2-C-methyl-D-erythritol 4-phosphate cytidylyltransferase